MVAKTWGLASTEMGRVDSLWGGAASAKAGSADTQATRENNRVPIRLNRADAKRQLFEAGIGNLVPPTSCVAAGPLLRLRGLRPDRMGLGSTQQNAPRIRVLPIYKATRIRSRIRATRNVRQSLERFRR